MGGKPTLTRKGYAVRDAEVRISKRGTEYVLVKVRLAVEDPARFVDAYVAGRDRERAAGVGKGDVVAFMGSLSRRRYTGRDGEEREAWSCLCDTFTSSAEQPKASTPDPAGAGDEPRPTEGNDEPVPVKPARLDDGRWGVRLPKGVKGATGMPCRKVLRSGTAFPVTLDQREQDSPYGEVWTTGGGGKPKASKSDPAGELDLLTEDDIPF